MIEKNIWIYETSLLNMVFQDAHDLEMMDTSMTASKKLTPGPYRATKMWNEIVRHFRERMMCKKHRRHLRTYSDCFSATESVDFLHELLKTNSNIGKDVTRHQTIQLLRKFLRNHVIEDVQGRWGSENFEDDGRLFRFPPGISIAQALRQPLGTLDANAQKSSKKLSKKNKRKTLKGVNKEQENNTSSDEQSHNESETMSTIKTHASLHTSSSSEHLKRPLPPVPAIPKCRVISPAMTESSINEAWKSELFARLQDTLHLDTLEEVLVEGEVEGKNIKHNVTKIGRSGVVQVEKNEDIPYWALSAMTCLANWPHGKDTGLPCYPGFERDVLKAVCEYYCESRSSPSSNEKAKKESKKNAPAIGPEPLLTYELYELFTNILCLIQPGTESEALHSLKYALLLLPPANRRKLHLLLRLMSKMCNNCHLEQLGGLVSTRTMLLQKFSRYILSCNEEVYLDELIATRLVTFLIDHHTEVMKVPEDIESSVEERIAAMRRPNIRYGDSTEDAPTHYTFVPMNGVKSRLRSKHMDRSQRVKRKSTDIMKSWDKLVTTIRSKSSSGTDSSDNESYVHVGAVIRQETEVMPLQEQLLRHRHNQHRPRTQTIASQMFKPRATSSPHPTPKSNSLPADLNESRMKPAKSCSDIFDLKISPRSTKVSTKTSELAGSSWNLRLRPSSVFARPFSKLRRSKA